MATIVHTPRFVNHESFTDRAAARTYAESGLPHDDEHLTKYMPDEVTRDCSKRMHYAAFRASNAKTPKDRRYWLDSYYRLRDRVVMGNRKLVFRAVRRKMAQSHSADDLIGDCQIVLIHAVAAYNPWMGVRFSTYAYTCLMRALSRMSRKLSTDWFSRSLPIDGVSDAEPSDWSNVEPQGYPELDLFLRDDHSLLSDREKLILTRRFRLDGHAEIPTLEKVGRDLGLSKERVRQVQASALGKLRAALGGPTLV